MIKKRVAELKDDVYLQHFMPALEKRHKDYLNVKKRLTANGKKRLSDFAMAHHYYGLHKTKRLWVFREWAPNAEEIYLVGDFSDWQLSEEFKLVKINAHGDWELKVPAKKIAHGMHYKLVVKFDGSYHDRLGVYSNYVCQDKYTLKFTSKVWDSDEKYTFKYDNLRIEDNNLLIYECHVGMAGCEEKIASYREFKEYVLPRIAEANYNTIQIMAVMSHPYYGSFGYHVANFFSISSNFGTPDDLKELIDEAHRLGLRVIIDLVHSNAVGIELINSKSPGANPFCTKAEYPPIKSIPMSLATLSNVFAYNTGSPPLTPTNIEIGVTATLLLIIGIPYFFDILSPTFTKSLA